MSLAPILWALKDAPVADSMERLVLVVLGEHAGGADGCTAFPSRDTIAALALADPKTVQRVIQRLVKRKLIAPGDQGAAQYIRADRRPVVYDLMIPYSWFSDPERVNEERQKRGLPPLTPADRPDIAEAAAKVRRKDAGVPRPKTARGDSQSPRSKPEEPGHGGTSSPARGDSESRTGGLQDPRTSSFDPPIFEPPTSLSPLPAQRPEPDPVHEREMLPSFEDHHQPEPDPAAQVTASWVEAYKRSSNGSEPSAKAVARVRTSAGSRLRAGKSVDELALIAADMAETNLAWTDLAEHEAHWLNKQQQWGGLTGTDATVAGWLQLADQLGQGGDPASRPSVTDQRVHQALSVGRQLQAEADARRGGYRPQNPNDAWDRIRQQADAGERPDGWEKYPHCGHPDCDEITRMRDTDDGSGELRPSCCSGCHPALQWY
ncbi:hypothetical protein STRTUCAR8_08592 [Streptomyces turgidiscabies Car8]|uniref:Helix-turn-helix domain-containing protein n=1 Tax=Streptomyces turgidiscabies (strain Car8) TaxID=698760 RepID=L7F7T5_STRT8|nr:helix-turn-helix domain-containing protein [Streptomyces turgidiscabies]ELP67648.1 hypothetical protein STRTUCAR8_08592 [Streptomyces turgidiscabies Car8]